MKAPSEPHTTSRQAASGEPHERYEKTSRRAREDRRRSKEAREKLRRYAAIYGAVLGDDRMCLCGMLAAEFGTLPEPMRVEMRHFFDENERWLVGVLKQGKREKTLRFAGTPADSAQALIGSLEGAMMIARSYADPKRFKTVTERIWRSWGHGDLRNLPIPATGVGPHACSNNHRSPT